MTAQVLSIIISVLLAFTSIGMTVLLWNATQAKNRYKEDKDHLDRHIEKTEKSVHEQGNLIATGMADMNAQLYRINEKLWNYATDSSRHDEQIKQHDERIKRIEDRIERKG